MWKILKRYAKNYLLPLALVIILTVSQALVQLLLLTGETKRILDNGVATGDMNYILCSAVKMVIYSAIVLALAAATSYFGTRVAVGIRRDISRDCYKKVLAMSPQDFAVFGESTLYTRCISDAGDIQKLLGVILKNCLIAPVIIVILFVLLFSLDPQIMLAELITAIIALTIMLIIWFKTRIDFAKAQRIKDRLVLTLREKIIGVRTIRAFENEEYEMGKTGDLGEEFRNLDVRANAPLNLVSPMVLILINLSLVVVFFLGTEQVSKGLIPLSTLILVIQYINALIPCLSVMPIVINLMPAATVASERVCELLEYEGKDRQAAATEECERTYEKENTVLAADDLCFGYDGNQLVLDHISFDVEAGEKIVIIGATGSGKTTLLNLLMGFYRPTDGRVYIHGEDALEMDSALRAGCFSYAPQKATVFQDTVLENIRAYHRDIPDEMIMKACDNSDFTEVIGKLKTGLNTEMAQGGMNLSGGQRKRLSLARALAKNAEIYLLDDPFAALDARTEALVSRRTMEQLKDKTVIMVAQKIASIAGFDRIIVLKDGRMAGIGSHEELLTSCDEYRDIYETQCYLEREA